MGEEKDSCDVRPRPNGDVERLGIGAGLEEGSRSRARKETMDTSLKTLMLEASAALSRLDSARLEELALSCQALNRELPSLSRDKQMDLARQSRTTTAQMVAFKRILEATKANLDVMSRLRDLREGRLEYLVSDSCRWIRTESRHGDN
jgi:hypothetical protein